jgi:hypothetical protein
MSRFGPISDIQLSQQHAQLFGLLRRHFTDFTAFVSAPGRRHFMRGNRVGPEEEALAVVNGKHQLRRL